MADYFYDGMPNVNERLNQLYSAFAAGPYNSLPLTGGNLTGPATGPRFTALDNSAAQPRARLGATTEGEPSISLARWLGTGSDDVTYRMVNANGEFRIEWSYGGQLGYQAFTPMIKVQGITGRVDLPLLKVSSSDPSTLRNNICRGTGQGQEILYVGVDAAQPSIAILASDGLASWGSATSVLFVGRNSETGRSIATAGTITAGGADYAEYLIKALLCGTIAPGQVVGIDPDGKLTDKWDRAVTFMSKSTNPCMVGGDSWAQHLGARPAAPARIAPTVEQVLVTPAVPADEASGTAAVPPVYDTITTAPGDTDDEWAAKQAAYETELATFELALEAARQTVDRIAFAGQVPVNVLGATPGQYIVPVQDGEGIVGMAMDEDDMTLKQYMRSIGKVIAIEEGGRARIIVKVA